MSSSSAATPGKTGIQSVSARATVLDNSRSGLLSRLQHAVSEAGAAEVSFLNRWSGTLPEAGWSRFLLAWARALEAQGGSADFCSSISYTSIPMILGGARFTSRYSVGGRHHERAALMQERKSRAFQGERPCSDYAYRAEADCLLCQNIMQYEDAIRQAQPGKSPALLELGDYLVLPNRYPRHPGSSLFLCRHHDDATTRMSVQQASSKAGARLQAQGKTLGRLISTEELLLLSQVSDALGLWAVKNHVADAMSLPEHDHWHLHPSDIPDFAGVADVLRKSRAQTPGAYIPQADCPFDNLIVTSPDRAELAAMTAELIEELERQGQVFTLSYFDGCFTFSPRIMVGTNTERLQIGGITHALNFDPEDRELLEQIKNHVPLRGQYGWPALQKKTAFRLLK